MKKVTWSLWLVLVSNDYDAAFLSNKIVLELCPILNESGVDNWHRCNGSWKAYFTPCQLGRQILIHPKSAYPIYISKGSNPFNFHEIGCLLEGDLDTRNTGISPIGLWLGGHHTWEITMQIIDVNLLVSLHVSITYSLTDKYAFKYQVLYIASTNSLLCDIIADGFYWLVTFIFLLSIIHQFAHFCIPHSFGLVAIWYRLLPLLLWDQSQNYVTSYSGQMDHPLIFLGQDKSISWPNSPKTQFSAYVMDLQM